MLNARYRAAGCGDNYEPLFASQRWAPSNAMMLGVIGHWNSGACPILSTIQFVGEDDLGWKKNKCTLSFDISLQPFSIYFPTRLPTSEWVPIPRIQNKGGKGRKLQQRLRFFVIKSTRCTNFTNLFCHETLHVLDSSSVHHQEFIHCTLSNGICHTGL